jgi:hypothetical protein
LFSVEYQLCKEFPAMSPFELERRTFHEVIGLYSRVRDMQIRQDRQTQKQIRRAGRGGGEIIRRPAGDNWF